MSGFFNVFGGFAALGAASAIKNSKTAKPIYIQSPTETKYKAKTNLSAPVNTKERAYFLNKVDNFLLEDKQFFEALKESPYDAEMYCKDYAKKLVDPWRKDLVQQWKFEELSDEQYYDYLIEYLKPCEPQWTNFSKLKTNDTYPQPIRTSDKNFVEEFVSVCSAKSWADQARFGKFACINTSRLARCISDMLDINNGYFPFFVRGCGLQHWEDVINPFNYIMSLYDKRIKTVQRFGREVIVPYEYKNRGFTVESRFDIEVEYEYDVASRSTCNVFRKIFEAENVYSHKYAGHPGVKDKTYDPIDKDEKEIHIWINNYDRLPMEFHLPEKTKIEPKPFVLE